MGDRPKEKKNVLLDNAGELMIESCIIVTMTIIMLFLIFALGLLVYQKSLQCLVANETAEMVAKSYMTGQLSDEPISVPQSEADLTVFGYLQGEDYLRQSECNLNARQYAFERLSETSVAVLNPLYSMVIVRYCEDARYMKLVEVDLYIEYEFLFGSLFSGAIDNFQVGFGSTGESWLVLTSSGSATATDLSEYINNSKAQARAMDAVYEEANGVIGDDTMNMVNQLYANIEKIFQIFQ